MHLPFFPEEYKIVELSPRAAANALSCDYISLKHVVRAYVLVMHWGANDTDLTVTPNQATAVAGTSAKATSAVHRMWKGDALSTSDDDWDQVTAAASYAIDPATQNPCYLLIEFDPAIHLDVNGGFDCITLADSGGHASNHVAVLAFCKMKEQGEGVLTRSLIVD